MVRAGALFAFSALLGVSGVNAWGALGHEAVGYIAMSFLTTNTLAYVKSSLGTTYSSSLGVAATWADDVRSQTAYKWSAPYHFIDAEDAPLSDSCSVVQSRDCGDSGCILTAITNYTSRLTNTALSTAQRQEALKFLGFIGDIGQPLHVEEYEVGGNDITAKCSTYTSSSNLHSVWDTGILTTNINANYAGSVTTYANSLITKIKTGTYSSLKAGWISCSSTAASANCPLVWAKEANTYDCSTVFEYTSGQDLCTGAYYTTAVPIIDLQLAKQGYRLAAWLNVLIDGKTM